MNFLLIVLLTTAVEPFDASTYFISFSTPERVKVEDNPLDYCGARIGLDVRNTELPRGHEGGYRFAARFPIIDYVSNDPLYMKQWAEDEAQMIMKAHSASGMYAVAMGLRTLTGTDPGVPITPDVTRAIEEKYSETTSRFQVALDISGFSPAYKLILADLYRNYLAASYFIEQALTGLDSTDISFFRANPGYYLVPDGEQMTSLTGSTRTHMEFIDRARKIKLEYVFFAAELMAASIDEYSRRTAGFTKANFLADTNFADGRFFFSDHDQLVIVSGFGPDSLIDDAGIIIDMGGDDIYLGSPAAGIGRPELVIDHAGDDRYDASDSSYTQGAGFLGVGFLCDWGGNDIYRARHFCQGAGILGAGAIWDAEGSDIYDAHAFSQGAGMFGLGMLVDDEGDDLYDCATLGQGGATTLGLGILSDLAGNDTFLLALTPDKDHLGQPAGYGQGGALSFRHYPWQDKLTPYGGAGMLADASGDDRYHSKGWCDQGGSYIMSLGVLYDARGDDHYTAGTGQGSGIHVTNAILIDTDGNDFYEGGFRSGGSGGDRSPGFLIDYAGNDTYRAGRACYGTGVKPFSYSVMIDYQGDDRYVSRSPGQEITFNDWESFGGVWPESEPHLWPWAICMDLGGKDFYDADRRRNNREYCSFGHGIHLDIEWDGGDVIGEIANPLPPYVEFELPETVVASGYYDDIRALQSQDNFIRFGAVGRLVQAGPEAVPTLVEALLASDHRQFNRDAMECIHYLFVEDKVSDSIVPDLVRLLDAPDPEVRTLMADNFGIWKIAFAEDALVDALADDVASVRWFALRSLATLESPKGIVPAQELAATDPSEDVRRTALYYLVKVDADNVYPLLVYAVEEDEASSVKVAALDGMRLLQNEESIPILKQAAESPDYYVRRAAGKALAELYQPEGIQILIESLSFPSIDAFDNYDRNVPNYIAAYAGHDLGDDRYEVEAWQEWFEANKSSIDIRTNVDRYRAYTELSKAMGKMDNETQIAALEEFLTLYPGYNQAEKTLAAALNRVAWFLVTDARGTDEFDPERAIEYADKAVGLDSQANYVDTQAETYLAAGDLDRSLEICNQALERWPGNTMFTDRLDRISELQDGR